MPKFYYIEKLSQRNIKHNVHSEGCAALPTWERREFLGTFYHCLLYTSPSPRD